MEKHSASTTLDDIVTELKLSYDSSIGLLDGDYVQKIPKPSVLLNMTKLLRKLAQQLQAIETTDAKMLTAIKELLGEEDEPEEYVDEFMGLNALKSGMKKKSNHQLSNNNNNDDDDDDDDDDDNKNNINDKIRNDDSINGNGANNNINTTNNKTQNTGSSRRHRSEDELDEDDISPSKRRQLNYPGDSKPIGEQSGSFTQANDTRLKNPKSEFVGSQTLPAEAIAELGLYNEESNGLETQGKEYLKKKYAVASYPENDLQDLLPGPIPDVDFSKNKPPSNQVQFTTFQTYIESFFRLFVPEDIDFLNEKHVVPSGFDNNYDPDVTPYVIPKLGEFYADVWTAEDPSLAAKLNVSPYPHQNDMESYLPKGSIDNLTDEKLHTEEISCGALSSRLLSAILNNNDDGQFTSGFDDNVELKSNQDDSKDDDDSNVYNTDIVDSDVATQLNLSETLKVDVEKNDFYSIEERLKRELKYIGIFMNLPNGNRSKNNNNSESTNNSGGNDIIDNNDWIMNREDDEVCAEIRSLQKELQAAASRNRKRKKKLVSIVEDQIAYQEYCTILEDLDKQVDQAYMKRMRVKNKKKKTSSSESNTITQHQIASNTGLRALLEKRKKWIDNIGKLFKPPELMKRAPVESVFQELESEDEGEDDIHEDAADAIIQSKRE